MNKKLCLLALAAVLLPGQSVLASDAPAPSKTAVALIKDEAHNKSLFSFDYGIPTSPALMLIGTSTTHSSPSAALKPYDVSVPASYGGSKDSQAFAFDFSPIWALDALGLDTSITYDKYLEHEASQILYRTRLTGGLFLGDDGNGDASKAKASRLAFGLSVSLLSSSDPVSVKANGIFVWKNCADTALNSLETSHAVDAFVHSDAIEAIKPLERVQGDLEAASSGIDGMIVAAKADLADCLTSESCHPYADDKNLKSTLDALSTHPGKDELDAAWQAVVDAEESGKAKAVVEKFDLNDQLDKCVVKANTAARNSADLDVGGGVVWSGAPGKADGFRDASGVVWIAGHLPLGGLFDSSITGSKKAKSSAQSTMIGGSLRASWKEPLATGDKTTPSFNANVLDAWVGLEHYTVSSRLAAQIGYMDAHAVDSATRVFSKSGKRWLISASIRVNQLSNLLGKLVAPDDASPTSDIWINATYGNSSGTTTTQDDKTFLLSLSYSPSDPFNLFGEEK